MIKVIFKRITELPEFRLFVDYWYVWFFIVACLMSRGNENFTGNISMSGYSQELIDGSLNRLSDFGLLEKTISSIVLGDVGKQNMGYKISHLGIQFINSTLT